MTPMNREQNLNNWAKTILASQGVKVSSDFCVIAASDDLHDIAAYIRIEDDRANQAHLSLNRARWQRTEKFGQ